MILVLLGMLEESFPRELARLSSVDVGTVSRYLDKLEDSAVTVSRYIGKERRVSINPRFVARRELQDLLTRLGNVDQEVMDELRRLRRRPRKRGKAI
jgi:DNA-binding MarR family transcriptional regulator